MQIADLISQLLERGFLLAEPVRKLFGSLQAFALRLLEAWRTEPLDPSQLQGELARRYQIRLQHY